MPRRSGPSPLCASGRAGRCLFVTLMSALLLLCVAHLQAQNVPSLPDAALKPATAPRPVGSPRLLPIMGPILAPSVRVTLSRPVYYIGIDPASGTPQMPRDVTASADVQNWPADLPHPQTFTWHIALDWNYPAYPTHHDIRNNVWNRPSPLTVDWGKQIRGGTLTVTAQTPLAGRDIVGQAVGQVRGVNPTHDEALRAFPRTRFGLICSKVAMAESGMRQFSGAKGTDPGGLPEMSRTNDLGIMQLNAPTGSITSQDQIWDWRENARRGMQELAGKQRASLLASRSMASGDRLPPQSAAQLSLLNFCRRYIGLPPLLPPRLTALSNTLGSGLLPDDPDTDHLALSQLERDAIRRYNGGREYAYRVIADPLHPDIAFAGWQVDPSRGGLRDRSGDLDYVRHVLRAHSGLTLPPPPKKEIRKQEDKKKGSRKHRQRSGKKRA